VPSGSTPPRDRTAAGSRSVRADTATTESAPAFPSNEVTPQPDPASTERTPFFHIEELASAADTLRTLPAVTREPIVRFHTPTPMPPVSGIPAELLPPGSAATRAVPPAADQFSDTEADTGYLGPKSRDPRNAPSARGPNTTLRGRAPAPSARPGDPHDGSRGPSTTASLPQPARDRSTVTALPSEPGDPRERSVATQLPRDPKAGDPRERTGAAPRPSAPYIVPGDPHERSAAIRLPGGPHPAPGDPRPRTGTAHPPTGAYAVLGDPRERSVATRLPGGPHPAPGDPRPRTGTAHPPSGAYVVSGDPRDRSVATQLPSGPHGDPRDRSVATQLPGAPHVAAGDPYAYGADPKDRSSATPLPGGPHVAPGYPQSVAGHQQPTGPHVAPGPQPHGAFANPPSAPHVLPGGPYPQRVTDHPSAPQAPASGPYPQRISDHPSAPHAVPSGPYVARHGSAPRGHSVVGASPSGPHPALPFIAEGSAAAPAHRRRWLIPMSALVVLGAIGGGVLALRLPAPAPHQVAPTATPIARPVKTAATLKFVLVPADAAITIEGNAVHTGSPWDTDLEPGVHQIEVHRDGYKSWLSSIDLAVGETRPIRIELEPLAAATDATLSLGAGSPGLEIVVDGQTLPARTPATLPLKAGPHTFVLRRDGTEVWKQELEARANAVYELGPQRSDAPIAPVVEPTPPAAGNAAPTMPPAAPLIVPSSAVIKRAGELPSFAGEAAVSARLCIDETGQVVSAELSQPGSLDAHGVAELTAALRTWQYAPYPTVAPRAACFDVALHDK
jgi:hypothetical protein